MKTQGCALRSAMYLPLENITPHGYGVYHGLRCMVYGASMERRHHRGSVLMERCCALHHFWVRLTPRHPMIESG